MVFLELMVFIFELRDAFEIEVRFVANLSEGVHRLFDCFWVHEVWSGHEYLFVNRARFIRCVKLYPRVERVVDVGVFAVLHMFNGVRERDVDIGICGHEVIGHLE